MDRRPSTSPSKGVLARLRVRAKALKQELRALSLVAQHHNTPWYARLWLFIVLAYALSPIDLIPDFIPVLGYIDDLVLIPLGIVIAVRMIPPAVLAECREQAATCPPPARRWWAVPLIVVVWLAMIWWFYSLLRTA